MSTLRATELRRIEGQLLLSQRDIAVKELREIDAKLDRLRKLYSEENGYKVPLRKESFEIILRQN